MAFQSESHGADAGPDLDQEMEKVFAMDGDKFDLNKICSSPDSDRLSKRSISDKDFQRMFVISLCIFIS